MTEFVALIPNIACTIQTLFQYVYVISALEKVDIECDT